VTVPSYALVASLGPDGVGKTTLGRALATFLRRRDPSSVSEPRVVQVSGLPATVFELRTARRLYQHVDFENNETEHALIASTRFSQAILVVSAADSVMPGTRRSLEHAREAQIARVVPVLSRCDEVDDVEMLDLVAMELADLLAAYRFEPVDAVRTAALPALEGNARWLKQLGALLDALDAAPG